MAGHRAVGGRSCSPATMMGAFFRFLMEEALEEARKALLDGEVPVGAVLADSNGLIVSKAHNQPILLHDPTAHAEILALRRAGSIYGNYRFNGATLVVTLEPCPMCMAAAVHARIAGWCSAVVIQNGARQGPFTISPATTASITP